jgi:hypothetical protein
VAVIQELPLNYLNMQIGWYNKTRFHANGAGISYAGVVKGSKLDQDERSRVAAHWLIDVIKQRLEGCEVDENIPAYADGCDEYGFKYYVTLKNGMVYGTWEVYKAPKTAINFFKENLLKDGIIVQGQTLKLHPDMESMDWFTLTPDQVKFE